LGEAEGCGGWGGEGGGHFGLVWLGFWF
jgi:hypothetical protein